MAGRSLRRLNWRRDEKPRPVKVRAPRPVEPRGPARGPKGRFIKKGSN